MISAHIMGSPVRRLTNPITRCWDQPHNRYAGTDDGLGTGRKLDTKRLTLMCARSWDTMACMNMQAILAIVPWTPMMAGTLTT